MSDDGRDPDEDFLTRFRTAESGPLMFLRETLTSAAAVAAVGLLLFAASGVWPPMVAVESGSMEPHMQKGDLVFITEPGRFAPQFADEQTGVVTYRVGEDRGYRTFGSFGSVLVYQSPQRGGPPIIHRARFYVQAGENWYDEANKEYIRADSCTELANCPAPHEGYITKGDNNGLYDQANGIAGPVKPQWIQGIARVRVPLLGWIRLVFSGAAVSNPGMTPVSAETTLVLNSSADESFRQYPNEPAESLQLRVENTPDRRPSSTSVAVEPV